MQYDLWTNMKGCVEMDHQTVGIACRPTDSEAVWEKSVLEAMTHCFGCTVLWDMMLHSGIPIYLRWREKVRTFDEISIHVIKG